MRMASTKRAYALISHVFTVIGKQMAKQVLEVAPHCDHDAAHGRWLEEEVGSDLDPRH